MIRQQTQTWLGAIGTVVTVSAFTVSSGIFGFVLGTTIALSWYALPPMYAFTIGQFALVAIAPRSTVVLGLLEGGLVVILVEPALHYNRALRTLVLAGGVISFVASIVWVALEWLQPQWKTVVVLTIAFTVVTYGLHRYERLTVGELAEAI